MNNTFTISTKTYQVDENTNSANLKIIAEYMQKLDTVSVPFKK